MAAVIRQPFAPLDGSRLQSLASTKNVQSSIPASSPSKRKVTDLLNLTDFENVDPTLFFSSKRAKSRCDGSVKDSLKPAVYRLTKSSSAPTVCGNNKEALSNHTPLKASAARPRTILQPKSPAKKLQRSQSKLISTPLSAPAGRSPTRGNKRIGLLNRNRVGRVDPPLFNLSTAPFSLTAAVKSTRPSYAARSSLSVKSGSSLSDNVYASSSMKPSWFFDIHEDTPEQEMTNLLQHSTCLLDISSDEETGERSRRQKGEARGKENIPPADDMSQTSARRPAAITSVTAGGMDLEKPRVALGDLNVEEFYAKGVDSSDVVIVPGDDEDGIVLEGEQAPEPSVAKASSPLAGKSTVVESEDKPEAEAPTVALCQPIEGTGESFELWESSSAKEEEE
ncbi:hypothetical protein BD289DRAFT_249490 [Coniella lustricola]|uniref:Thymidylate kinase n=1 Tax=Coniella lustricola TaxID=2025994 RepID=A0A2T3A8K1_9PEZI|nr:hypothetical protein BD289DRAFT_249490 [Coniella lustricola]